jgi:hypothetical protein
VRLPKLDIPVFPDTRESEGEEALIVRDIADNALLDEPVDELLPGHPVLLDVVN